MISFIIHCGSEKRASFQRKKKRPVRHVFPDYLFVSYGCAENTEISAWNSEIPKMKLFTKVISGLKAGTQKVHKENAPFSKLKLFLLVSQCSTTNHE